MTDESPDINAARAIERPLVARLEALGLAHVIARHAPVATVAEAKALRGTLHGHHIKNLFLRDRKRRFYLVTVLEDREVDLKALRAPLDARGTLSFATPDHLRHVLGLLPGAVTPLAVINDEDGVVTLAMDEALRGDTPVFCHPLHNAASLGLSGDALVTFVTACDHAPIWLSLD